MEWDYPLDVVTADQKKLYRQRMRKKGSNDHNSTNPTTKIVHQDIVVTAPLPPNLGEKVEGYFSPESKILAVRTWTMEELERLWSALPQSHYTITGFDDENPVYPDCPDDPTLHLVPIDHIQDCVRCESIFIGQAHTPCPYCGGESKYVPKF